jgi:putative flippase GtrA
VHLKNAEGSPAQTARALDAAGARRETRRFLKFLVVGAFGFVVDTGSLSLFVLVFSMNRVVAKGIAFSLAVISNFIWNRLWTYPESRSKSLFAQVSQFFLVSVVGLGTNLLVFAWVDKMASHFISPALALYAAQCGAVGVALFWNYAANRVVTYNDIRLGL